MFSSIVFLKVNCELVEESITQLISIIVYFLHLTTRGFLAVYSFTLLIIFSHKIHCCKDEESWIQRVINYNTHKKSYFRFLDYQLNAINIF